MTRATKDFSYHEFAPKGAGKTWMPDSEYQKILVDVLAENLQVLRNAFGFPLRITSGVRTLDDYNRLKAAGYNPSETSDHNYGVAVPTSGEKAKKFGPTYNFTAGAVDIVPIGSSVEHLFDVAVSITRAGKAHFGQVILEMSGKTQWVHLSNSYEYLFGKTTARFLGKAQFLTSDDGGKTYRTVA